MYAEHVAQFPGFIKFTCNKTYLFLTCKKGRPREEQKLMHIKCSENYKQTIHASSKYEHLFTSVDTATEEKYIQQVIFVHADLLFINDVHFYNKYSNYACKSVTRHQMQKNTVQIGYVHNSRIPHVCIIHIHILKQPKQEKNKMCLKVHWSVIALTGFVCISEDGSVF
jgi:GTP:adenosylcobinamide-phosphate guanylyltransferase